MQKQEITNREMFNEIFPEPGLPPSKIRLAQKVRELRQIKGWTLNELAEASGLAVSTLSKIENERMSPTFDVVQKLAQGLAIDIVALFSSSHKLTPQTRRSVTHSGQGRTYETAVYKHLLLAADLSSKKILPFVTEIKARTIEEFGDLDSHGGEEFVYVLEGEIRFFTDCYEPADLGVGDSIYIDSSMRHACISISEKNAKVLWVNTG